MNNGAGLGDTILYRKIYGCLLGGLIGDAMGAPTEGKTYQQIQELYGEVRDFDGVGTDDTAIRNQLCDAIVQHNGHVTVDEFAASFLKFKRQHYRLWWVPVRNMFHKVESKATLPVDAGYGNMQSSSSAMAIAPMGILNACDPRQATLESFDVAGLIHSGPTGFCRDAASGVAAAVAEAFQPNATVEGVIAAATNYLHPESATEIRQSVQIALTLARQTNDYVTFRQRFYERHLYPTASDSRETFPVTLALLYLSGGKTEESLRMAANFGRDADTIATMIGGVVGALNGVDSLRPEWVAKLEANPETDYRQMARQLAEIVLSRASDARARLAKLDAMTNGLVQ